MTKFRASAIRPSLGNGSPQNGPISSIKSASEGVDRAVLFKGDKLAHFFKISAESSVESPSTRIAFENLNKAEAASTYGATKMSMNMRCLWRFQLLQINLLQYARQFNRYIFSDPNERYT
jgi:hypothetical protein